VSENQTTAKAKIMFETRRTTFEMFFLRCLVSIRVCGRFFEERGMPFQIRKKRRCCYVWRSYIGGVGD
jgi:hypothetical protein